MRGWNILPSGHFEPFNSRILEINLGIYYHILYQIRRNFGEFLCIFHFEINV